ncbi:probable lipid phosphate phosphatase beta [Arachis stenosperma]|uniref:probable lipid phosphate phosphatase beta n=1 Tax=Arachis stenosperma TaxID=217475 RepID=UPI0025AC041F|nr:probable lipid phosphate phosphatase beta [Arachis stenosperma]XP_057727436.1 probable lipid phosphate phosphatase beta [Arachis stenosperma]XP_057727508.1 probable lipid phosphate phosphatase beta [Arachis stenosperma]XP_057727593.1 probable lipid phosphate phosphatase beta [Arachis stenosperma]XP_057727671.1 probable lipid phosphate phosphatase beta [Arachis stenosperma]XP_057727742.1 probable lipid phosphate phosphatase beta [Arachis stenosperma]XP_057727858.1 probable lipid phosphate p
MGHLNQPPPKSTAATSPPQPFLLRLDAAVSLHVHNLTKPFAPRPLLRFLELLADFRFFFPVSVALLLACPYSSPLRRHLFLPLALCSLLDLIFIAVLKLIVRRSRPTYSHHGDYNAVVPVDHFSFPSGHTSRVFFVASIFSFSKLRMVDAIADLHHPRLFMIIDHWFGGEEVFAINAVVTAVWAWASATALSRIALGRHYVLDVFFGACFGVLEALFTLRFLEIQTWI